MLTKGIIKYIDQTGNTCEVRMPIFEIAGNAYESVATAITAVPAGIHGGLQVNDIVILGFEENNAGKPVILGKLFLGNAKEATTVGGSIHGTDLIVTNSAILPADTKIAYTADPRFTQNRAIVQQYTSLTDIIQAIAATKNDVAGILDHGVNSGGTEISGEHDGTNWTSLTIAGETHGLNAGGGGAAAPIYSTNEQSYGAWIDGKPIYKKTIEYNFVQQGTGQQIGLEWYTEIDLDNNWKNARLNHMYSFIHTSDGNILNAQAVDWRAARFFADTQNMPFDPPASLSFCATVDNKRHKLCLLCLNQNYTPTTGYFTLEYMKVTD